MDPLSIPPQQNQQPKFFLNPVRPQYLWFKPRLGFDYHVTHSENRSEQKFAKFSTTASSHQDHIWLSAKAR